MSSDTERSPWKTPEGRAKYLTAYETTLALWPVPYEERDVPTRFGTTHIVVSGPEEGPPVVLLHAMGYRATSWFPNVGELSRVFRVYAVDRLGDINKSVLSHPLRSRPSVPSGSSRCSTSCTWSKPMWWASPLAAGSR